MVSVRKMQIASDDAVTASWFSGPCAAPASWVWAGLEAWFLTNGNVAKGMEVTAITWCHETVFLGVCLSPFHSLFLSIAGFEEQAAANPTATILPPSYHKLGERLFKSKLPCLARREFWQQPEELEVDHSPVKPLDENAADQLLDYGIGSDSKQRLLLSCVQTAERNCERGINMCCLNHQFCVQLYHAVLTANINSIELDTKLHSTIQTNKFKMQ